MTPTQDQARSQFQDELDLSLDGEAVELAGSRERPGPIVVRHPITLDGRGCTVWAKSGPVVTVTGANVVLKNLRIEYTADGTDEGPNRGVALRADGPGLALDNVTVRGAVVGLPAEEGEWRYPHQLNLGSLALGQDHSVLVRLVVPVPCQLTSEIAGVQLEPRTLAPGCHEVRVRIEQMIRDTLISGTIGIKTAFLRREIVLNAHFMSPSEGLPEPARGLDRMAWEPADWVALVAAGPVVAPPPASIPVSRPSVPPPSPPVVPPPPPPPVPVAVAPPPPPPPPPVVTPPLVPVAVAPAPAPAPPPPPLLPPVASRPAVPPPPTTKPSLRPVKGPLLGSLFTSPPVSNPGPNAEPPPVVSPPVRSPVLGSAFSPPPTATDSGPPIPPDVVSPPASKPLKSVPIKSKNPLFNPTPPPPSAEVPTPAAVPPVEVVPPSTPIDVPTTDPNPSPSSSPNPESAAPPAPAPKKKFRMAGLPAWAQEPKPVDPPAPPPPADPTVG